MFRYYYTFATADGNESNDEALFEKRDDARFLTSRTDFVRSHMIEYRVVELVHVHGFSHKEEHIETVQCN